MQDTPQRIKKMQLQIWLSKSPAEWLLQRERQESKS